jgi:hypothetical protein
MPIWIRGMRWEDLPLPKSVVVVPCVYEGTPRAHDVYMATKGKYRGQEYDTVKKEKDDGTRRGPEFKKAFERCAAWIEPCHLCPPPSGVW